MCVTLLKLIRKRYNKVTCLKDQKRRRKIRTVLEKIRKTKRVINFIVHNNITYFGYHLLVRYIG